MVEHAGGSGVPPQRLWITDPKDGSPRSQVAEQQKIVGESDEEQDPFLLPGGTTEPESDETRGANRAFQMKRSFSVALAAAAFNQGEESLEEKERRKLKKLFNEMDTNDSGKLSQSQLTKLIRSMGDRMSAGQISTAMQKIDLERTGQVNTTY